MMPLLSVKKNKLDLQELANSDEIDFSQDCDESSDPDSNTAFSIADKMEKCQGYSLKVHKNSEAMAKILKG